MVFLRDEGARAAVEEGCRDEGLEPVGWREVPVDPSRARRRGARASMPRIEQLALRPPRASTPTSRVARLPRAPPRRADAGRSTSPRSPSARSPTRRSAPPTSSRPSTPTSRDPTLAVPFGIFHQRFSTNTTPSWERAQPFRLLCHNGEINTIQGNVNWMRAREAQHRLGRRRALPPRRSTRRLGLRACSTTRSSCSCAAGATCVTRSPCSCPPAWEANDELAAARCATSTATTPRSSSPGTGRRASSSPTATWSAPRSTATGSARFAYAVVEDGLVVCSSEAGAIPLPEGARVRRGKLGPGQMIAVDPGTAVSRRTGRSSAASPAAPVRELARGGPRARATGRARSSRPRTILLPRQVAVRLHARGASLILRPIAAARRTSRPTRWATTRRCRRSRAGRGPLYHYFKQRFAQVTNPPIDHLRERLVMSLRTLLGARAPLLIEGPEVAAGDRARELLPLSRRARRSSPPVRLDATFDAGRGARGGVRAARRRGRGRRRRRRRAAARLDDRGGPGGAPIPALLATGAVHHRLVAAGLRTQRVARRRDRRAARDAPLRHACSATAPTRSARGSRSRRVAAIAAADKLGGDRPSPAEAQHRFRQRVEDGVLKVMSKMGISDVASYRGAQIFEALGLAPEVVDRCFVGTPCRDRRHRLRRARARGARAARGGDAAAPRLENPGYVKCRKGGEPHATTPEVVDSLQDARPPPTRCARRSNGRRTRRALRALRRARERTRADGAARPARARPGRPAGAARRGRAGRGDRPALLRRGDVARRALGRGARDASRSRSTASAARRTRARAARIRPASATERNCRSSRSPRAASASRPSTPRSPRSSRSRSRRARSPARAASSPATR